VNVLCCKNVGAARQFFKVYSSSLFCSYLQQYEYDPVGRVQKLVVRMICRSRGGRNNNHNNDDNFPISLSALAKASIMPGKNSAYSRS
jgi:hypothetical protein